MGGHHHEQILTDPSRRRRANLILWILLAPIGLAALLGTLLLWPAGSNIQPLSDPYGTGPGVRMSTGTVTETRIEPCPSSAGLSEVGGKELSCEISYIAPTEGGAAFALEVPPETIKSRPLKPGDRIKYLDLSEVSADSSAPYVFVDFVRTLPLSALAIGYVIVVCLVARWRGLRALLGLIGGLAFIVLFMLPALLEGKSPLLVGLVGSTVIMFAALYFAHGFSARTSTALLGTLFGLGVTAGIAVWASDAAALTGATNDTSITLGTVAPDLSLSGLLLCGLLIAGLGVLNDVTITQSSAIWELAEIAPDSTARQLFTSGMRIGRDHIASTVYTIAFAYAGAALPILILTSLYDQPLLDSLSTGEMAEEIIRILVGSIGLVLAIPVTTAIAVAVVKATGTGAKSKPEALRSRGRRSARA